MSAAQKFAHEIGTVVYYVRIPPVRQDEQPDRRRAEIRPARVTGHLFRKGGDGRLLEETLTEDLVTGRRIVRVADGFASTPMKRIERMSEESRKYGVVVVDVWSPEQIIGRSLGIAIPRNVRIDCDTVDSAFEFVERK